ncbi:MAG: ribosome recycling factor [bacterium]
MKQKFEQVRNKLEEDFKSIRTGRASSGIVENIIVSYYGQNTPLKQMANIQTPDAAQIVIQPWDKNSLGDIELAIRNSDLNLSPVNDGQLIRISLPPMTEERRGELVRNISKKAEEARIALRNVRGEAWEEIQKLQKSGKITEDDKYSAEDEINKIIGEFNKQIEEIFLDKEKEIKSI